MAAHFAAETPRLSGARGAPSRRRCPLRQQHVHRRVAIGLVQATSTPSPTLTSCGNVDRLHGALCASTRVSPSEPSGATARSTRSVPPPCAARHHETFARRRRRARCRLGRTSRAVEIDRGREARGAVGRRREPHARRVARRREPRDRDALAGGRDRRAVHGAAFDLPVVGAGRALRLPSAVDIAAHDDVADLIRACDRDTRRRGPRPSSHDRAGSNRRRARRRSRAP